jgi:hypothetical protein
MITITLVNIVEQHHFGKMKCLTKNQVNVLNVFEKNAHIQTFFENTRGATITEFDS